MFSAYIINIHWSLELTLDKVVVDISRNKFSHRLHICSSCVRKPGFLLSLLPNSKKMPYLVSKYAVRLDKLPGLNLIFLCVCACFRGLHRPSHRLGSGLFSFPSFGPGLVATFFRPGAYFFKAWAGPTDYSLWVWHS